MHIQSEQPLSRGQVPHYMMYKVESTGLIPQFAIGLSNAKITDKYRAPSDHLESLLFLADFSLNSHRFVLLRIES